MAVPDDEGTVQVVNGYSDSASHLSQLVEMFNCWLQQSTGCMWCQEDSQIRLWLSAARSSHCESWMWQCFRW